MIMVTCGGHKGSGTRHEGEDFGFECDWLLWACHDARLLTLLLYTPYPIFTFTLAYVTL